MRMQKDFFEKIVCEEEPCPVQSTFQATLFDYLNKEQQAMVRPILRVLKKGAQEELAVALLDHLETGACDHPTNFLLASIFAFLTGEGRPLGAEKVPWIIRPLVLPAG